MLVDPHARGGCPLDGVGVDFEAAVAQEALESDAPGLAYGQAGQLLLPQIEERRDDGRGLFLAHLHPRCGILRVQPLDVKRPMA